MNSLYKDSVSISGKKLLLDNEPIFVILVAMGKDKKDKRRKMKKKKEEKEKEPV